MFGCRVNVGMFHEDFISYTVNTGPTEPLPMVTCPDLPPLTNGMITYSGSTNNRPVGSTATHSCDNGHRLVGEAVRSCGSGGSWDGTTPVCQRK